MATWDSYTQKSTPADADTLMIKDTSGGANKRTPFSGVWNWILTKLTNAVISQLETTNKSIIPAINELNSKTSNEIKFTYKNYPVDSFENISAMLRQCADDMPSDSKTYIVRIVYGSAFTAIIQSYDDDTYRAVFAISYTLSEPSFQVKRRGEWIS